MQLSLFEDETARLCHWHVPDTHFLEAWSDARAFDGTVSIVQPLIAPLYECKSPAELVIAMSTRTDAKAYDVVRDFWQRQWQCACRRRIRPDDEEGRDGARELR